MSDYFEQNPGDEEGVPRKLMALVAFVAVLGVAFFVVSLMMNRQSLDPSIDPSEPTAFEQTDAGIEQTPDLWVRKKPLDDAMDTAPNKQPIQRAPIEQSLPKAAAPTSNPS